MMRRGGGGRGRAGFVSTLPPKPAGWQKSHDELNALLSRLGIEGHVGHGFILAPKEQQPPDPPPRDPKVKVDPLALVPELPKRVGAWTLYVWSDDAAASSKLPPQVGTIPIVVRSVPAAGLKLTSRGSP
jgi:hypothetical protein